MEIYFKIHYDIYGNSLFSALNVLDMKFNLIFHYAELQVLWWEGFKEERQMERNASHVQSDLCDNFRLFS